MITSIGGDSETYEGPPISFQFIFENYYEIIWTNEKKSFLDFIAYCTSLPNNDCMYVIWIHNLNFDAISFFYDRLEILQNEEIDYKYRNWHITGIYSGGTCFIRLRNLKTRKTVMLLDTMAFFQGSLDRLAKLHCPHFKKLAKPKNLGHKQFLPGDKKFEKYALRDSEISKIIGEYIVNMHKKYDVSISVSCAQFASKIFRRRFLKYDIVLPDLKIVYGSQYAYHGGKNGIYCKRGLHEKIYGIDIISAYPHAMYNMPSFSIPDLFYNYKLTEHPNDFLPNYGIYRITGTIKTCAYPILFNHDFRKCNRKIDDVWSTGWEINEALKKRELIIEKCEGYFYDADHDDRESPLKMYVKEFFEKKQTAGNDIDREFYKILLNSLYGKFIQTNKNIKNDLSYDISTDTIGNTREITAGGLYNPFIAALITGHTRAKIHNLEHKFCALHTSTDGIMCKKPLKKSGSKLGDLKLEFYGDVYIVRNKLYIIYSAQDYYIDKITNKKIKRLKSKIVKNKYIDKYALHGFAGGVSELEDMIIKMEKGEKLVYNKEKRNTLKRSLKSGLKPNNFEEKKFELHL